MTQQFKKGDTAFYIAGPSQANIVKATVVAAYRSGKCKLEAQWFFYEGKDHGPYIGTRFIVDPSNIFVSALAADYEIQARRGLTL